MEVWHWTPLVALIVLGGLAALPVEPYEAAHDRRGHRAGRRSATSRCRCILPFIVVAAIIRTIDALKTFDTIFVITQGGPGVASETINIHLYHAGIRVPQHRLRLGARRRVLRDHRRDWRCSCCTCGRR